jgi:hypothetical protein
VTLRHVVVLTAPEVYGPVRYLSWDLADGAETVERLRLPEGAVVELLAVDMGYVFFRYDGVVYGSGALHEGFDWPETPLVTETWCRLVATDDAPAAWVRLDLAAGGNVEVVPEACEAEDGCEE